MGTLMFHTHTNIDSLEANAGDTVTDAGGRKIRLDVAQFYISNISLKKTDGTFYKVKGAYIMKYISHETYLVGQVPAGNYTSVSFDIGIDSVTNATNPDSYPATSPLSIQNPVMWFGTTTKGYIFVNVQGLADTTWNHTGTPDYPFSYQIGTNALLKHIDMPSNPYIVIAGQTQYVHMICDYGILLRGINFKTQNLGDPFNYPAVANQIASNIHQMFRYEM